MVYVVQKGWQPLPHLMREYWRGHNALHFGNTKKAEEIKTASKDAHKKAICIGIAAILSEQRIEKYPHIEDKYYPMVEHWDVEKIFSEFDKNYPPGKGDEEEVFWTELYNQLLQLIYDEALDKRNTDSRRAKVVTGELEPTEEDKAYFAEQARQLQEQAQRFGQLGGTVDYLVKGGRTQIDV